VSVCLYVCASHDGCCVLQAANTDVYTRVADVKPKDVERISAAAAEARQKLGEVMRE
jgi:hypothetical protein